MLRSWHGRKRGRGELTVGVDNVKRAGDGTDDHACDLETEEDEDGMVRLLAHGDLARGE